MATEYFNDAWRIPNNKNQSLVSNYSMEFDPASTDYIDLGSEVLFDSTSGFSFSTWVKLEAYSPNAFPPICKIKTDQATGYVIFLSNDSSYYGVNIGSNLNFIRARTDGNISADFIGTWKHICVTFDGVDRTVSSSFKIYVDGSSVNLTTTGGFASTANENTLGFGSNAGITFNGKIDQTCFFNYALSASQVATLYGGGTAVTNPMGLSPAPVAYYQLGDQTASNNTTEPTPAVQSYLVPNNSLQDYVFDFSSDRIAIPSYTLTENSTVSLWVNFDTIPSVGEVLLGGVYGVRYMSIKSYLGNFQVLISASGQSSFFTTNTSFLANTWYHVCIIQDSYSATLYINGEAPSSGSTGNPLPPTLTTIGAFSTGAESLNGQMSNVALFSTNLPATGTESIASLYNNGSPALDISSYSGLQRWYKLNAEDVFVYPNWVIRDSAGTNNGASINMTSANLVQSNLQLGVGFSPYALELDGISQYFNCGTQLGNALGSSATNFTLSGWFKTVGQPGGIFGLGNGSVHNFSFTQSNYGTFTVNFPRPSGGLGVASYQIDTRNQWANFVIVFSGNGSSPLTLKFYSDGVELNEAYTPQTKPNSFNFSNNNAYIGNNFDLTKFWRKGISNFSFFDISLTSAQVTELNNNQRTSNLNNLSFAKPLAWWQLGSNSSFNSNTWTALNEGTVVGGNAVSAGGMAEDDIVNGVGYTGNGLGTSSIEIIGDAPYSTANGISENMDVLDRTTDVPG